MTACEVCGKPAGTGGARYQHRPARYCSAICRATGNRWKREGKPAWRIEIERLQALCETNEIEWRDTEMTKRIPPGPLSTQVARSVARLRKQKGMTYTELVKRLEDVGRPIPILGLRRIERGERRVDADDMAALARVFGVEPWSLTGPPHCDACLGSPPAGFTCNDCGAKR
ncbi:helix-turn-helix domain-containing protein [Micromonospora tulbaghiae]|uniref:helix-turn-helix domain-containing protein n=1 Tax=Micromonospora tulbaghiae TaxID=479978 RepID=UPI000EA37620|nr:helix-turn-helix transcriptional regulator [Micromonospora tulbaghiae]